MTGQTLITFLCECAGSCAPVCPVDCIHKDNSRVYIDQNRCIDCGACASVCPIEGAVLNYSASAESTSRCDDQALSSAALKKSKQRLAIDLVRLSRFNLRIHGRLALWSVNCVAIVTELLGDSQAVSVDEALNAAREYARALYDRGVETYRASLHHCEPDDSSRERLETAREASEGWASLMEEHSETAANLAVRLALHAVSSACRARGSAANFAAQAIEVALAMKGDSKASATCEAVQRWQFDQLVAHVTTDVMTTCAVQHGHINLQ
jgi:NAD-dependent dihydropyrimidine dehydrogenase PreA subunit